MNDSTHPTAAAGAARPSPPTPEGADATGITIPPPLVGDLRSDHAGETGAVRIYQGVLAVSRDPGVRAFAERHLATEREHLRLVSACFPRRLHSRLLPLWSLAGWLTGALPALFGARAVYATIDAVETFVDHHYQEQVERIDRLAPQADPATARDLAALRALITRCQADEVAHRDEAAGLLAGRLPLWLRAWRTLVGAGSAQAVKLARVV